MVGPKPPRPDTPLPPRHPRGGWVGNHTSRMGDRNLGSYRACAGRVQLHGGWVGFLKTKVLDSLGCLWFNRTEVSEAGLRWRGGSYRRPRVSLPLPCSWRRPDR